MQNNGIIEFVIEISRRKTFFAIFLQVNILKRRIMNENGAYKLFVSISKIVCFFVVAVVVFVQNQRNYSANQKRRAKKHIRNASEILVLPYIFDETSHNDETFLAKETGEKLFAFRN